MGAKLIRDKLKDSPELAEGAGKYIRKVQDDDEHHRLLVAKLFEEIGELMIAVSNEELLEEWIDIYTVVMKLIKLNFDKEKFYEEYEKKYNEKGGYDEGWVWDRHKYLGE